MVSDLIKFPLNVLTGDVVVLRKPISEIDPWIGIIQKVNGRRVRFDWVCKNEEDVWEGIERYDIWDKANIIAVVKGGGQVGSCHQSCFQKLWICIRCFILFLLTCQLDINRNTRQDSGSALKVLQTHIFYIVLI